MHVLLDKNTRLSQANEPKTNRKTAEVCLPQQYLGTLSCTSLFSAVVLGSWSAGVGS